MLQQKKTSWEERIDGRLSGYKTVEEMEFSFTTLVLQLLPEEVVV